MSRKKTWEVSDAFWEFVQPLIPTNPRVAHKTYQRQQAMVCTRGEEKKEIAINPEFKARRWVVERTHSWFNRFRKLIPRYEKTDCSYLALTSLAAALITLNQVMAIYG